MVLGSRGAFKCDRNRNQDWPWRAFGQMAPLRPPDPLWRQSRLLPPPAGGLATGPAFLGAGLSRLKGAKPARQGERYTWLRRQERASPNRDILCALPESGRGCGAIVPLRPEQRQQGRRHRQRREQRQRRRQGRQQHPGPAQPLGNLPGVSVTNAPPRCICFRTPHPLQKTVSDKSNKMYECPTASLLLRGLRRVLLRLQELLQHLAPRSPPPPTYVDIAIVCV